MNIQTTFTEYPRNKGFAVMVDRFDVYGCIRDTGATVGVIDTNGIPPIIREYPDAATDDAFNAAAIEVAEEAAKSIPPYNQGRPVARPTAAICLRLIENHGEFPGLHDRFRFNGHWFPMVTGYHGHAIDDPRTLWRGSAVEADERHGIDIWVTHEAFQAIPDTYTLTVNEAAEQLGLESSTIRRQIGNGRISAIKHGRDWFIHPYEIERYGAEHLGKVGQKLD